jgi:hypothetical protein
MQYQLPPDVLHYEVRLIFGLTAQDIMAAGMAAVFGIQRFGPVWGILMGLLALASLKRFDHLGRRSIVLYLLLWAVASLRPTPIVMPRVLPGGTDVTIRVEDWEGNPVLSLGGDSK